jgi:hypothetical protein
MLLATLSLRLLVLAQVFVVSKARVRRPLSVFLVQATLAGELLRQLLQSIHGSEIRENILSVCFISLNALEIINKKLKTNNFWENIVGFQFSTISLK